MPVFDAIVDPELPLTIRRNRDESLTILQDDLDGWSMSRGWAFMSTLRIDGLLIKIEREEGERE